MRPGTITVIPAKAGIQGPGMGSRLHGNDDRYEPPLVVDHVRGALVSCDVLL